MQPATDARSRELLGAGSGTLESYTVTYERDGTPAGGIVSALLEDGRRAIGKADPAILLDGDPIGRTITV